MHPNFHLRHFTHSTKANIILHGGSVDMNSAFMMKVFNQSVATQTTTLTFNFPYIDRGDQTSSGDELIEEITTLTKMIQLVKDLGISEVTLIGKSLGGIVASYYLNSTQRDSEINFDLGILGYVVGQVKMPVAVGKLVIVQGELDKFGDAEAVKSDLSKHNVTNAIVIGVPNATHSYTDVGKNPLYEDEAVAKLFAELI
jgi:predicted alpha/beta-hydrolase family hydrolase